jgi:tRNA (guanine-N7-)-methyltransferase
MEEDMRLRHIKGAEDSIGTSPYVVQEPKNQKGQWAKLFGNNNPIEIEVGMGKGKFIMELAQAHPEINYIGIERYPSVLLRGLQKRAELELSNIWFLCVDAKELAEVFEQGEVNKIYLNFSDPWPKDRHAKRRLTSPEFMAVYDQILAQDGSVEFKTDNQGLFEYSLEAIPAAGWQITEKTFDLHNSPMAEGNVMTEYETKFVEKGNAICKLIAKRV